MRNDTILPILNDPVVAARTSAATRRALEERAAPPTTAERYLSADLYLLLEQVVATTLPQDNLGTEVDIAAAIDQGLREGASRGWRYADLPPEGEAYPMALTALAKALERTPFEQMPLPQREEYLFCLANGEFDEAAKFPLSKWLKMLRTDVVKIWLSHPSTIGKLGLLGFADGATGSTDGPTVSEGWQAITPNSALPFEQSTAMPADKEHGE